MKQLTIRQADFCARYDTLTGPACPAAGPRLANFYPLCVKIPLQANKPFGGLQFLQP